MKVPVICFWVLSPPRLFVFVRARGRSREGKTSVTEMWVSECLDQAHTDRRCLGVPHTGGWTYHMSPCTDPRVWLIACMHVRVKGMCVWKTVPEGSRQSKGVNSSSMGKIRRSLVFNQSTHLELSRGGQTLLLLFLLLSFFCLIRLFCCLKRIKGSHFIFHLVSNPSLSPAVLCARYSPWNKQTEYKLRQTRKHNDTKAGSLGDSRHIIDPRAVTKIILQIMFLMNHLVCKIHGNRNENNKNTHYIWWVPGGLIKYFILSDQQPQGVHFTILLIKKR